MKNEHPRITADLVRVSYIAHEVRKRTLLSPSAVARLTGTSIAYWKKLRSSGNGPRFHEERGYIWYVLADLQDWLGLVVHIEQGG
jgi:hypothetical protein